MRSSLFQYHTLHPEITTVLVGTRRTDPFASTLDYVQRCDPDWPPFLRVHPILDWSFHDVWLFLNTLNVEYCVLYDQGYTSLGDSRYTVPNPQLKSDSCPYGYLPAWKLKDETQERAGRQSVPKKLKQDLKC
ncbi:hypothetical protein HMI54_010858 [Coelomomyces lativittatus]|nr:hypothetical protein HMI55_004574 [Coelomomyces lativittatus]KAJ1500400.1 hypothetical protein HMI54_010858 [Coelomomyces lativittatus]KAJ1506705.1 hypothetical protein HMI56_000478 [Coelomomyces lativittatus]